MTLQLTPTTELAAVNEMLTAIGTAPVETLVASGLTDASIALDTLSGVNREVQSQGWWFNRQYGVTINLSPSWTVPDNYITIRPARGNFSISGESRRFVTFNNQLFDQSTNSAITTGSVKADVVVLLDFENIPEPARRYITVRAAKIFQTKVLGDDQLGVFTEDHETEAWQVLEQAQLINEPHSTIFMDSMAARMGRVRRDPVPSRRRGQQQGGQ